MNMPQQIEALTLAVQVDLILANKVIHCLIETEALQYTLIAFYRVLVSKLHIRLFLDLLQFNIINSFTVVIRVGRVDEL